MAEETNTQIQSVMSSSVNNLYIRNISKCIFRNPPELIRKANKTIRCKAFNLSIICVNRKAMNQVEAKETLNVC